ncbi:MAG: hypothetical protein PHQ93_07915 [Sulfurimonas sp.]|uniref:hypothetical protein n=1 Tax=Sulfurimonas sp. TaxID=2022749 RepID=UPI0026141BC1|nr:hypothetical protein [Sulfurimonas sp.]MDD5401095.1 hypothetical protein [Sulfurimonas sp.]
MDCSNIQKITDVTDQVGYDDTNSGGRGDSKLVSCGQDGGYNELKDKFIKYFNGVTQESYVAKLMCECCKKMKPTGKEKVLWADFYKCMLSKVTNETPNTLKKLQELIKWHEKRE